MQLMKRWLMLAAFALLAIGPAMALYESISTYNGVTVSGQCVIFIQRYASQHMGISVPSIGQYHSCSLSGYDSCGAHWIYDDSRLQPTNTDRISNNGTGFPQAQDIVVWSSSLSGSYGYGHVAVVDSSTSRTDVVVVDSNWAGDETGRRHTIQINGTVLGWFRKRGSDTDAPSVTITSGQSTGAQTFTSATRINWHISDATGIAGWGQGFDSDPGSGQFTTSDGYLDLPVGTHTLHVHTRDTLGNERDWTFGPYTYDVAAEWHGNIDTPANNSTVGYDQVVSGWAYEATENYPVQWVEIAVNGQYIGNADYGLSRPDLGRNCGFSYNWNSRPWQGQTVDLRIRPVWNGQRWFDMNYTVTVPDIVDVGELSDHTIDQRFVDGYNRTEGIWGSGWVGIPTDLGAGLYVYAAGDGSIQAFNGGRGLHGDLLAKNGAANAYFVQAEFADKWNNLGNFAGFPGWPIDDRRPADRSPQGTDGALQRFEGCNLYTHPAGIFEVHGSIRDKYSETGKPWYGTGGTLGFPTSDELSPGNSQQGTSGRFQHFEGGFIYYSSSFGAHPIYGAILTKHEAMGGTTSILGFPTSDPYSFYNRTRQDFEGGSITDGVVITLALNPTAITGGQASTGTITLSGPGAPGGTVITLSSSATAVATVPATVTVPEGATTATFTITTAQRSASATATIHAALADLSSDATLTVNASLPTVSFTTSTTTPAGTTPINGGTIYNTMPPITGVAADAIGGVTKVDLHLYQRTTTSGVNKWWTGSEWQTLTTEPKPKLACALSPAGGGAKISWIRGSSLPTGANLPDGVYYMSVNAYDAAGKLATAVSNFRKATDTTAPTVRFTTSTTTPKGTTPISGGTIYNAMPAITGVAADAGSAVSRVDLYLYQRTTTSGVNKWWTGNAWQTLTTEPKPKLACTLSPVSGKNVTWTRSSGLPTGANLPDGVYYMSADAYDAAGKHATAVSNFRKATDAAAPTVSFTTAMTTPKGTTPISGSMVYNTMPAITGVAADAESGVAKVDLYLYQRTTTSGVNKWWTGTEWLIVTSGDKPKLACTLSLVGGKSVTWSRSSSLPTGANLPDGTYYMAVNAYDTAGKSVSAVSNFIKATKAAAVSASVATIALPADEAEVSSQSVRLTFLGAIDAETSTKCFTVEVNGTVVSVNGVEVAEDAVTVLLPDGALHAGDAVTVTWSGLHDATGAALADGIWLGSAK